MKKTLLTAAALVLASTSPAFAEDFPAVGGDADEFDKGFSAEKGLTQDEKDAMESERLKVGGRLWSEFQHFQLNSTALPSYFFNPNTVWVYLDSRLRNDIRTYFKLRAIYDPTVTQGGTSPLTGLAMQQTRTDLEELKLMFNLKKTAFFTIGKQKIKWGSGRLWNPTDFLNIERRDLLFSEDRRLGVALIKTHIPIKDSNFYLIQRIDNSFQVDKIQHAVRAEIPIGPAEIIASASFASTSKPLYGLDVSSAIWDFDVYGEVSYTGGSSLSFYSATGRYTDPNRPVTQAVGGISYDFKYSDSDAMTFALEYFYNDAGYTSTSDYASVFAYGGYQPFVLGNRYGSFLVNLQSPGSLEKWGFMLSNIANLMDMSAITKLNIGYTGLGDLRVDLGLTAHYGNSNGEFKFGNQLWDASLRFLVDF